MESSPERCLSGPRGNNGDSDEVLKDGRIDLMELRILIEAQVLKSDQRCTESSSTQL